MLDNDAMILEFHRGDGQVIDPQKLGNGTHKYVCIKSETLYVAVATGDTILHKDILSWQQFALGRNDAGKIGVTWAWIEEEILEHARECQYSHPEVAQLREDRNHTSVTFYHEEIATSIRYDHVDPVAKSEARVFFVELFPEAVFEDWIRQR